MALVSSEIALSLPIAFGLNFALGMCVNRFQRQLSECNLRRRECNLPIKKPSLLLLSTAQFDHSMNDLPRFFAPRRRALLIKPSPVKAGQCGCVWIMIRCFSSDRGVRSYGYCRSRRFQPAPFATPRRAHRTAFVLHGQIVPRFRL